MSTAERFTETLAQHAMPELSAALRQRAGRILERWAAGVEQTLPDADPLTRNQVRNSIPIVLEQIAKAIESNRPEETATLLELTKAHGISRFHQAFDITEVLVEYRLLRGIVVEEVLAVLGTKLDALGVSALNTGIDIALQQAVVAYVRHQSEQLKLAVETQSKYLSYLSHDLRNNLNSILLQLDVLNLRLKDMPQFREDVQDIASLQRSIHETFDGMDRLLQAERLRKKAVQPRFTTVDLRNTVADIMIQYGRQASEKGLKLENAVPQEALVNSDRDMLLLVLQNLVGNAIKYSTRGSVRISAQPRSDETPGWTISVSDEGAGIPQEQLQTLFNAFQRGETFGQKGVGLGLTIASEAATVLGSALQVQSQVDKGSTFSLSLPAADEPPAA